jgi:hypothetical protein
MKSSLFDQRLAALMLAKGQVRATMRSPRALASAGMTTEEAPPFAQL